MKLSLYQRGSHGNNQETEPCTSQAFDWFVLEQRYSKSRFVTETRNRGLDFSAASIS